MAGTKRMRGLGMLALLAVGMHAHAADEAPGRIERIQLDGDEVVVVLSRALAYDVRVLDGDAGKKSARRLVLDFANATLAPEASQPIAGTTDLLRQVRPGQFSATTARIVLDLGADATHSVSALESPPRVAIALAGPATAATTAPGALDAPKPPATAAVSKEAPKQSARTIPIRARGRRPYSLLFAR